MLFVTAIDENSATAMRRMRTCELEQRSHGGHVQVRQHKTLTNKIINVAYRFRIPTLPVSSIPSFGDIVMCKQIYCVSMFTFSKIVREVFFCAAFRRMFFPLVAISEALQICFFCCKPKQRSYRSICGENNCNFRQFRCDLVLFEYTYNMSTEK